jgi:hypothetical protein
MDRVGFEPMTSAQQLYLMAAIKGELLKFHPVHFLTKCSAPPYLCYQYSSSRFMCQLVYNYHDCVILTLVYSIRDSTEVAIQKMMIKASQRMVTMNSQGGELGDMNPPLKRHLELEIKTLQNAPKDQHKLRHLLKTNERKREEAMEIKDTQRLATEIKMLKIVLHVMQTHT